ncbi:hypothetical protein D3C87_1083890 [compost metagenome]
MGQQLINRALHPLGRGPVVAEDIKDQRVVALTFTLQFVEDLAGLRVGMFQEAGIHLHQPCLILFLFGRQAVPGWEFRRARRKDGVPRDKAQSFLASERLLTIGVPTTVELAFVFIGPLRIHLVRAMHGTRCPIHEKWFFRRVGLMVLQPVYGLIGEIFAEVIFRISRRFDWRCVAVQTRFVLRGFAGQETVEMFKTVGRRPCIERTGRCGVQGWRVMPFAERGGAVAILLEHLGHGRRAFGDLAGVAFPIGGQLCDDAVANSVMVASGKQSGASCGADGSGMKSVVAHTAVGDSTQGRRMDCAADGVGLREAGVIEHDHQNIGGLGRKAGLMLTFLVLRFLQRRFGVTGRRRRRERQRVLCGCDRAGQQCAEFQGETSGGLQLLGHGCLRFLFITTAQPPGRTPDG